MKINKAYKFRLYPTNEQKTLINKTFGCTRLVYNYYLNKKQELYENENKSISVYDYIKHLKNLYIREYICPNCNTKLDRDFNASENIMFEGLKIYMKELLS